MKIHSIRKYATPVFAAILSCAPLKTAKEPIIQIERDAFKKENVSLAKDITYGLRKEFVTNFRGGVIERFDSTSLEILKKRIADDTTKIIKYCFPLKEKNKAYTEPFGHFFANRPGGRQHLGLDIFTTKFAKKPEKPVTIVAPIDGIVVSNKFARKKDNIIGNSIGILGVDGRKYVFDHMARGTDYADSIVRPKVGQKVKMGSPLGYVGSTGETVMWHLHLAVMTGEQKAKQLKDAAWLKRAKQSPYSSLTGQVDPLNKKDAGGIADTLKRYLKEKK